MKKHVELMRESGEHGVNMWDTVDGDVFGLGPLQQAMDKMWLALSIAMDAFQVNKGKHSSSYSMLPCKVTILNLDPAHRNRPETTWIAFIIPGGV